MAEKVQSFCEERDWDQFHGPKDLAVGLSLEAAELLEQFRYLDTEQELARLEEKREEVGEELADCLFFLLRFSQKYNFNLEGEFYKKLAKNAEKYPVEKAKGQNRKYDEL